MTFIGCIKIQNHPDPTAATFNRGSPYNLPLLTSRDRPWQVVGGLAMSQWVMIEETMPPKSSNPAYVIDGESGSTRNISRRIQRPEDQVWSKHVHQNVPCPPLPAPKKSSNKKAQGTGTDQQPAKAKENRKASRSSRGGVNNGNRYDDTLAKAR